MDRIILALMTGSDIPIPECSITLHQPTIQEIGAIGEKEFWSGVQFLCLDYLKYFEGQEEIQATSNFQLFMSLIEDKQNIDKRRMIEHVLFLLFPKYKLTITPRSLLFNFNGEMSMIDENNFLVLQDVLKQVSCQVGRQSESFNPVNAEAAAIARKLERGRQRVAAQKQSGSGTKSVFSQYLSILAVGLHMPLTELIKLTVYQLFDLMERYTLFVDWDLDIRQRLAGGKPDKEVDNWMKVIH